MNILYSEKKNTVETYNYEVNRGGDLNLKVSNGSSRHVSIEFVNGKFNQVTHNIEGDWVGRRSYWYVMGAIAEKIHELETAKTNCNNRETTWKQFGNTG